MKRAREADAVLYASEAAEREEREAKRQRLQAEYERNKRPPGRPRKQQSYSTGSSSLLSLSNTTLAANSQINLNWTGDVIFNPSSSTVSIEDELIAAMEQRPSVGRRSARLAGDADERLVRARLRVVQEQEIQDGL